MTPGGDERARRLVRAYLYEDEADWQIVLCQLREEVAMLREIPHDEGAKDRVLRELEKEIGEL